MCDREVGGRACELFVMPASPRPDHPCCCYAPCADWPNKHRLPALAQGPPRPPPPGFEGAESLGARLHSLLDGFEAAPFTLQRLCEVLLEPRKQYARLDKVVRARAGAGMRPG